MIEVGRRGFITGLAALVAAPAVIRVAPLMKISTRLTPLYVPVDWLADAIIDMDARVARVELEKHAWPQPLADNWINIRDYDPDFVRQWAAEGELTNLEYWLS
jgi:hypothetical protein